MELKITSDSENKLLGRREIIFSVEQENSTPNKIVLAREICKRLSLNPESTVVVRIDQGFGRKESTGFAHSYENKQEMEKHEPKHLITRINKKSGAQAAEGAPKAEEKA
jgi:small subunit ribosomal protein S24e